MPLVGTSQVLPLHHATVMDHGQTFLKNPGLVELSRHVPISLDLT